MTRKFSPNFLVGTFGGYEDFDYTSVTLNGRLKGGGWTAGSYLGWKIVDGLRFDATAAYSGIGFNGTAGPQPARSSEVAADRERPDRNLQVARF